MILVQTFFEAEPDEAREIAAELGPYVLVSSPAMEQMEWSYRTMSASLFPLDVAGEEVILQGDWRIHGLKKDPNRPFADTVLIGRASSNDVVLNHSGVSKLHARLLRTPDGFVLEDAGSVNGTFVGESRLSPNEKRPVKGGALLCFGTCSALLISTEALLKKR